MKSLLLGQRTTGFAFIVSAPAGTGKTTLVNMLLAEFPTVIASISWTTRKPRLGEKEGVHYHFITREEFEAKIAENDFLEYVELYGDFYGTSRAWVDQKLKEGLNVILVIDTQGALKIKPYFPATYIFIKPPSLEVLRKRLEKRKTECTATVEKRLAWAQQELTRAREYDYELINDDLGVAYQILRSIIIAQCHAI